MSSATSLDSDARSKSRASCIAEELTRLIILLIFMLPLNALAEYGCPDGMVPVNEGNGQNQRCVVDYNLEYWQGKSSGAASARPSEIWATRWGAIAVNGPAGAAGSSAGEETKEVAQDLALERCGQGCSLKMTYRNQCAAIATGGTSAYSVNGGESIKVASSRALKGCERLAGAQCKITFTDCSLPERIR